MLDLGIVILVKKLNVGIVIWKVLQIAGTCLFFFFFKEFYTILPWQPSENMVITLVALFRHICTIKRHFQLPAHATTISYEVSSRHILCKVSCLLARAGGKKITLCSEMAKMCSINGSVRNQGSVCRMN